MKRWIGRIRDRHGRWRRVKRYRAFVARLSSLRIEADQLGLTRTHNKIAAALTEIVPEIRSKDWGAACPSRSGSDVQYADNLTGPDIALPRERA